MSARRLTLVALLSAGSLAADVPARTPTLASITEYVSVVGADGAPVGGLRPDDFRLTVDGVAAPIEEATPNAASMSIALVLDATTSVPANGRLSEKTLERVFLPRLRPGDRARVFPVAATAPADEAFTADTPRLKQAIERAVDNGRAGPSPIWDSLWHAGRALGAEPAPRVILLASDGRATGNDRGYLDMLHALFLDGITVAVVSSAERMTMFQMGQKSAIIRPDAALQDLADRTGGPYHVHRNVPPTAGAAAKAARLPDELMVDRIVTELQRRYALRFTVPADGVFHQLAVTVDRPGATVRARKAFIAR